MTDTEAPDRPLHLRWSSLGLVAAGGSVGTALREGLVLALPIEGSFPVVILGINLLGAFLLGALMETLVRRGPDSGRRRIARLLLGTGVLGGFTTYSALATDASLLLASEPGAGILYGLVTVVLGAGASWLGIAVAMRVPEHSLRRYR